MSAPRDQSRRHRFQHPNLEYVGLVGQDFEGMGDVSVCFEAVRTTAEAFSSGSEHGSLLPHLLVRRCVAALLVVLGKPPDTRVEAILV